MYGIYHGRFIEMLLNHFDKRFTEASATANPSVALGAKVTADWWTLFRSPVIDTLVKDAIAGSPTLDSAKARLASAREAITEASAAPVLDVRRNSC